VRQSRFPMLLLLACGGAALLAALGSCRSAPAPQDVATLSAPKLVQAAQGAADKGNYALALEYYRAVRDRFPGETERFLWASYEIAFINHKMGNDEEAIRLLDELVKSYADRNDPALPQGPLVLARKVQANLVAKRTPVPAKPSAPATQKP
jgi:outer membrane protein assembly factor BamD (BamD/ComL family)